LDSTAVKMRPTQLYCGKYPKNVNYYVILLLFNTKMQRPIHVNVKLQWSRNII